MKKTFKLFGAILMGAAVFAACQKDPEVKPSQKATELSIEPAAVEADLEPAGPFDVAVKANGTWAVVNALDWVTVEPKSGDGNATVSVTVAANLKDGAQLPPRSGEITFVGSATASATLSIKQAGDDDLLVEKVPYSINFCEGQSTWTIEDKLLPEALTFVWSQTTNYGMKASAYVNQCYATESWLISPVFDLTGESVAILTFEHALNKGTNANCYVAAKVAGTDEWVKLDVPVWPGTVGADGVVTGASWNFVESGEIDLAEFCGKKARIAFVYGSTAEDAPTWEVDSLSITNDASPRFSVPTEDINIRAFDKTASIKVSGNVDWKAVASEGASVEPAEGKGGATVAVTVPENTDRNNDKVYTVKFSTEAAVDVKEYTVRIVQAKAEALAATTLAEIFENGAGVYATAELTVMAKAAGNVIVSDGTANMMFYKKDNTLEAGNVIKFDNADVQERNGLLQINGSDFTLLDKTVTPEYGEAVEIATDDDVQNWAGEPQYQYIHFVGTMDTDNRTVKCGEYGIYIVATEGFAGKEVSVYGYANGTASSYKTITTTLVSIEAVGGGEEPEPPVEPVVYKNCGEINAAILAGETTLKVDFEDFVEVTLVNGKNVFAQDATGGILFYGTGVEKAAQAYMRFKGAFTFTATVYENLPEITAVEGLEGMVQDWNAKYPCKNITIADLNADFNRWVNCKVKIVDVEVKDGWCGTAGDRDGEIAQGDATVLVRVQDKTDSLDVKTGCKGDIVAWPTVFGEKKQLGYWPEKGKNNFNETTPAPGPDPVEPVVYKNCGEINAAILAGETSLKIELENPAEITLVGADKKSIFVQDATGGVLVYSSKLVTDLEALGGKAGYAVKGAFDASATLYNGLPEVVEASLSTANFTQTWKFPCKTLTLAEVLADFDKYLNCKVLIKDVEVVDGWSSSDKNGKIAQDGKEIAVYAKSYGQFTSQIVAGSKGNFCGYVSCNNGTKQLAYWEEGKFNASFIPSVITAPSTLSLEVGQSDSLKVSVTSGAALAFASDNESVVTVSAEGVVTGVAEGSANITVTAPAKDSYGEAQAVIAVTVKSAGSPEAKTYTLTFPDENKDNNKVTSYTQTWEAVSEGFTYTIVNFNNNSWFNDWTYIRGGSKKSASVASIATKNAVPEAISVFKVTFDSGRADASKLNDSYLEVSANEDFSDAVKYPLTVAEGEQAIVISAPAQNRYYRMVLDIKASSNGAIEVSKVVLSE